LIDGISKLDSIPDHHRQTSSNQAGGDFKRSEGSGGNYLSAEGLHEDVSRRRRRE
jgi:hypothetical protein